MRYVYPALLLLLASIIYKMAVNTSYLRRLKGFQKDHIDYVDQMTSGTLSPQSWDFVKKCEDIKALFLRAGISDQTFTWMEPAGLGFAKPQSVSMFNNISVNNAEIQSKVVDAFHRATGIFERRRRDALSFFYWVDTLLHLPANVLKYVGIKSLALGNAANVIGWFVGILAFITSLPDFIDLQKWVSHYLAAAVAVFHR